MFCIVKLYNKYFGNFYILKCCINFLYEILLVFNFFVMCFFVFNIFDFEICLIKLKLFIVLKIMIIVDKKNMD